MTKDKVMGVSMMSNTKRTEFVNKNVSELPGPGVYDSPSKLGSGPHFTIGNKK